MNKDIEQKIISSFIIELKQERAKFELWNEKKRRTFIWDISERNYYNKKYAQKIDLPNFSKEKLLELLKKNGAPDECYVLNGCYTLDGEIAPLKEALDAVVYNGPALISCIHGKLAYLEGEPGIGAPERYLLIKR